MVLIAFFILFFILIGWLFAFDFETSGNVILSGESAIAIGGLDLICAKLMAFACQFIISCAGFFKTGAYIEIVEREFLNEINTYMTQNILYESVPTYLTVGNYLLDHILRGE